ncbi:sorting nexin-13-like isoform X1 [Mytilus californianus]|uniref:sorting nexin-13-like isoform X1 n=1 Tax=Mytilus californianus TaxID=6549 RepID=UPI0022468AB4|nr:sorting nexin-13-like isoform X1 [Mytilus californianus]
MLSNIDWKWPTLGVFLFLVSFGNFGLLLIVYFMCILVGGLVIAVYHGRQLSMQTQKTDFPELPKPQLGVMKIMKTMENITKIKNFDKRMTGASVIDEVLQEVLRHAFRDYIKAWYRQISDHDGFLLDIRQTVQKVAITFATRSKEVDWMPYFTQRLVDDFASHIKLYRRATDRVNMSSKDAGYEEHVVSEFFDLELEMEKNMCRDVVCLDPDSERQYLQDLSEVLLFLLLPQEDFHNKSFRYILREVLVNGIFLPTIDLMSDPDYVNQNIAWFCTERTLTNETFLQVAKSSIDIDELEAVKEIVEQNIHKWRSKDSGGIDDALVKQNLNSLIFVKTICEGRIKRLIDGVDDNNDISDICRARNIFVLSLDEIIENNIALAVFIEFMTSVGGQMYLFFYLNVEGFRAAAEQQIRAAQQRAMGGEATEADLESLRRAALIIHDQYLSEKASSRIKIDSEIVKRTLQRIKSKFLSESVFDEVAAKVYQILHTEQYYEKFLQSNVYMKLMEDLGLVKEDRLEEGDSISIDDDISLKSGSSLGITKSLNEDLANDSSDEIPAPALKSNMSQYDDEVFISAFISQTGIVKEAEKSGKTYAVFAVRVTKKVNSEDDIQEIYRRYSDFHDLNMLVQEKFPDLPGPGLPGKTVLKNMNQEFLEKRRKSLDNYLQNLLNPQLWEENKGLKDLLMKFLAQGLWEKHKSDLARKMDTIVNPLRTAGRAIAPEHIVDGLGRKFRSDSLGDREKLESGKVAASIDQAAGENIPLRIMLLLMDEVFDLQHKNQWLRRRIVPILRQLLKATYGDTINRKIVEHVDWMTSAEQMAEYIKKLRDAFWPDGVLAEPRTERDHNTKMRTRIVCKAKMLGSITDEMKTLMGQEAIKKGVTRVFDMFQHRNLNRRLVYVFLEGVIITLFPHNKFSDLFCKLHSRSSRLKAKEELAKSASMKDSGVRKRTTKR